MAEFDEKLNSLLSNPDAMSQIMQLAQSLSGGEKQEAPPAPPPSAPAFSLGDLLQSGQQTTPEHPRGGVSQNGSGGDLLSSLTGGMDPGLMLKLLPLVQELGSGKDSHARQLLYALRPYLREDRQDKVERALQLARLFHIGKKFLSGWEGFDV